MGTVGGTRRVCTQNPHGRPMSVMNLATVISGSGPAFRSRTAFATSSLAVSFASFFTVFACARWPKC